MKLMDRAAAGKGSMSEGAVDLAGARQSLDKVKED